MKEVAIAITTYQCPKRLACLLKNMDWAGWPSIPTYIIIDAPKDGWGGNTEVLEAYERVISYHPKITRTLIMPKWGCMQGSINHAFDNINSDWIIYVPDDILFTKGGLFNEYAGTLIYGESFVGGIQSPYWNADELFDKGVMPHKACMYDPNWRPERIVHNPHWDGEGLPRLYVNLNGAGFSLSTKLWREMRGWPKETWRLDEYAGFMAWKLGYVCLTLPGPPRIHYFGATTDSGAMPEGLTYHTEESWKKATGYSVTEAGQLARDKMLNWGGDGREFTTLLRPDLQEIKDAS